MRQGARPVRETGTRIREPDSAAVYRLQTKVRKTRSNPKLYPTFTLPRGVNLAQ